MAFVTTLEDIRQKVRRITARPSAQQIKDDQINDYINTFYIYDLPRHLQLISNRVNYQFVTNANVAVYDLPNDIYLSGMPPVFIGGYRSFMTQSRDEFFRINPKLNYMQQSVSVGTGATGPYSFTLPNVPIMRGWKTNPPGAYSISSIANVEAQFLNWMVLISGTDASGNSVSLIDDGQGHLFDPSDVSTVPTVVTGRRGTINYITGAVSIPALPSKGFITPIASGAPINAQYVPYVASRPQSLLFYQQQFTLYPVPDQAYTVSLEAYRLPTALLSAPSTPTMLEFGQVLAYGAADKIFSDNADMENQMKFRPLLDEQLKLIQRRTIIQQTSDRTSTIYTEQAGFPGYPFGNLYSGF